MLREWESHEVSGEVISDTMEPSSCDGCLLNRQYNTPNGMRDDDTAIYHRVSFEITAEELRYVEKKNLTGETSKDASEKSLIDCKNG